ncbi:MAG: DUF1345 domain-containing protein [Burkholderiales bacterium]|nr:DUF1345 domain-containing protein [Burkholderiales bacterium]
MLRHVRNRPRMFIAAAVGLAVAIVVPGIGSALTRALLGWNVGVWLFLVLIGLMMLRADHDRLRRVAVAQAEGAATVLAVVSVAAVVSIVAIVFELSTAKQPGAHYALPHALFALTTVAGAWLLLPTLFAMNYASLYYLTGHGDGLQFPSTEAGFKPDYADFLYFSFTIAVASQTADVSICTRPMRRLVLLQSVLSFVFNTTILAFTINIAASLF